MFFAYCTRSDYKILCDYHIVYANRVPLFSISLYLSLSISLPLSLSISLSLSLFLSLTHSLSLFLSLSFFSLSLSLSHFLSLSRTHSLSFKLSLSSIYLSLSPLSPIRPFCSVSVNFQRITLDYIQSTKLILACTQNAK